MAVTKEFTDNFSAKFNCEDRMGAINLFFAAAEGSLEQALALLDARVDPNFRDYEQRCPLHVAAGRGEPLSLIQLLMERKADVNALDMWGQTPLYQSQQGGHVRAERLLKANGAKLQKLRLQKKSVREKWHVNRSEVKIEGSLGTTNKSAVNRATWNGIQVVAKFGIDSEEDLEDEMLNELELLATIRHPDLVMFLGCCIQQSPLMILFEYMPCGDMENYYKARRIEGSPWSPGWRQVDKWARAILRALNFMHSCAQPIIHRDLKPLNILLSDRLEAKITDFGISKAIYRNSQPEPMSPKRFGPIDFKVGHQMTGGVGTLRYMAPEVARHEAYTEKIDIYAFALILYFMSSGHQPFYEYKDMEVLYKELSNGAEPRPKASECSACFRPILEAAWNTDPDKRPSAGELVETMVEYHSGRCGCTVA